MAETPAETSSTEVVPTLTKTDARELKSLVSRDTKILLEELDFRSDAYLKQLNAQYQQEIKEIQEEQNRRREADNAALVKEMSKIHKQIDRVNAAIRATLVDLEAAGWHTPGQEGIINKGRWQLELNRNGTVIPPASDFSDLEARTREAEKKHSQAYEALMVAFNEARRVVTGREADVLRDLTLQSITTEAAREFILDMPTSDELLPPPVGLTALPGPVSGIVRD